MSSLTIFRGINAIIYSDNPFNSNNSYSNANK